MPSLSLLLYRRAMAAVAGLLLAVACNGASAALTVCNKGGAKMEVAVAYVAKDAPGTSTGGDLSSTVRGWWAFAPGECAQVLDINAGANWVSIYAESRPAGRVMSGNEPRYCVTGPRFAVQQRASSPCHDGWRGVGFHRIETAKPNHTFTMR